MKDCTTCKYGYEDERLGIPMCHHPKRFSEDCVDFNMHEEAEKPMQEGLDVTDFCKPIDPGIAQCIADHSWEMLGEDEKPVPADLEEAAKEYSKDYESGPNRIAINAFIAGAKWQEDHTPLPEDTVLFNKGVEEGKRLMMDEWLKDRDGCFWDGVNEGKKAMREQMMKEAVEGKVYMSFAPGHNQMVMADVDLPTNTKVKLIIVKED